MIHINESIIGRKGNYLPKKYFISELILDERKLKSKGLYNNFDKFDKWLEKIEQKLDFNEFASCLLNFERVNVNDYYKGYIKDRNFLMQIWNDLDELYEKIGQQEYICGAFQIEEFGEAPICKPMEADIIFVNMAGRTFYLYKK